MTNWAPVNPIKTNNTIDVNIWEVSHVTTVTSVQPTPDFGWQFTDMFYPVHKYHPDGNVG